MRGLIPPHPYVHVLNSDDTGSRPLSDVSSLNILVSWKILYWPVPTSYLGTWGKKGIDPLPHKIDGGGG